LEQAVCDKDTESTTYPYQILHYGAVWGVAVSENTRNTIKFMSKKVKAINHDLVGRSLDCESVQVIVNVRPIEPAILQCLMMNKG
jgi:hypothetical protein